MLPCFAEITSNAIPIILVKQKEYAAWLKNQDETTKRWLESTSFKPDICNISLISNAKGQLTRVIFCIADDKNNWDVGHLPYLLPPGEYVIDKEIFQKAYAISWGLGAYQFTRYKAPLRKPAKLCVAEEDLNEIENTVSAIYFIRDLINTPTDDLGPSQFAEAASKFAKDYNASFKQIIGDELLKENYASIYTVGRASDDPPRLIDIRYGDSKHPLVTLVGKGVCFDSGGLDLKPSAHMLLMKKDMAGGAHVLGLARMIIEAKLPISLRILIPMVENVVSGGAYRPGDIIKSRKGLTIEVGNTDAEGRLILADALTEAVSDKPDLLIDITTLTGAARVAVGTEVAALFSNHIDLLDTLRKYGDKYQDPIWPLPLYTPYRDSLNSQIADINNNSVDPYAGAITAALFLKEFVPDHIPWLHFDMMAWNLRYRPGRPIGGEAMAVQALFHFLRDKFAKEND